MTKVKIGVIGVGNMGSSHCGSFIAGHCPEIELVAIADRREARRNWAKETLPETVTIFEEGDDLIDSGLCDAVIIAVPHYQHPTLAIKAFEKGLHVMCEKPAGVYTKAVKEMNAAAEKSGKVFGMMFNQRTNCIYRKMKEIIDSGELGEIRRVNWIITDWFRTQAYYDSGDWRATWDGEGGGVLLNQCPHQLDLIQWICGMPSKVRAFTHNGKWHDIEVEDDVTAYLEYPNGATGVFITTTGDFPGTNRFEVTLDGGKIVVDASRKEAGRVMVHKLKDGATNSGVIKNATEGFAKIDYDIIEAETDGLNPQHVGVLNAFAGKILHGTPLVAEGYEGINGLTLSNAMHLSSWTNDTVTLPIDEDLFLAELNKRREASTKTKEVKETTFSTEGTY
ncbi:MAG: Gfo/Idh/MocA family oxidoreductase [Ruminococcaceae bacterium]|nr:Gfo/Idh/MocA family oxidoreductase [Oscillospiraceae bacterium]